MTTMLQWDQTGERFFRTGLNRGVLQVEGDPIAVVWNGLTSISDEALGGEHKPIYFEGVKTLDYVEGTDTQVVLECITYPTEFDRCDGLDGVHTNQRRQRFNLAWREKIGNDVDKEEHGYLLHLLYNCTALPTKKMSRSLGQAIPISTFSWTIHTVPVEVSLHRPTSHLILNSITQPEAVAVVEEILYGEDGDDPIFPTFPEYEEVVDIVGNTDVPVGSQINFPASNTWVVPAGVFKIDRLLLVGPGGPGGRSTRGGGGGGGGEVVSIANVPVIPGETITISLGAPAAIAASSNIANAIPGDSSIAVGSASGLLATAIAGGNGGGADNDAGAQPGACGGGGAGGTSGHNNLGAAGSRGGNGGNGRGATVTTTRAGGGGGGMAPENGTTATSSTNPGIGGDGLDVSLIFGAVGGAAGIFGGGGGGGTTVGTTVGGLGGTGGAGRGGGSDGAGGHNAIANTGGGGGGNGSTGDAIPGTGGTGFAAIKYTAPV